MLSAYSNLRAVKVRSCLIDETSRHCLIYFCAPAGTCPPLMITIWMQKFHLAPQTAFSKSLRRAVRSMAATSVEPETTVSAEWLKERLGQPDIKVLDASWYMPVQARDGVAEFKAKRIPGTRFFDIDGLSDANTDLPHMLPSNTAFSVALDALGIKPTDTVVVYDGMGCFSAPRAWWTLKVFGHEKVYVLEGGLPAWELINGPLDTSPADEALQFEPTLLARKATSPGSYPAQLNTSLVRDWSQMLSNINAPQGVCEQVIDARSKGRYLGTEPEPRPGLKGGHIPGSKSLAFPNVLESWRLKSAGDLKVVFTQAGVDLDKPLVGSCGSGLSACILALAVHKATGGKLMPVYDGSWSEWGAKEGLPISTSEE